MLRFHFAIGLQTVVIASALMTVAARAEVPNTQPVGLHTAPIQIEATVLSVEEKPLHSGTKNIWHRIRIDRVIAGEGLRVGDETAVVSSVYELAPGSGGSTGQRGSFRGINGLPIKGDHARLFATGSTKILQPLFPNGWQSPLPRVDFIAADDEYRSEITLPFLAGLVEQAGIARTRMHFASAPADDTKPDAASKTAITDGDKIAWAAEALVVFMRYEQLRERDLASVVNPTEGGLPLVAFRTSTHAFAYPEGSPNARWNAQYGERFLGTPWRFHHGHASRTRILPPSPEAASHPILKGVAIPAEGLVAPSWLYQVEPLPTDCKVLLWGEAIDSESPGAVKRQPIVWVRELARETTDHDWKAKTATKRALPAQRIAVTTLGHPGDFALPAVRLLTAQMVAWSMGREDSIDDAKRAAIRAATFDAPKTR